MRTQQAVLAIIGCGHMGAAIARAAAKADFIGLSGVVGVEPDQRKRETLRAEGLAIVAEPLEALQRLADHGRLIIAVKPQAFPALAQQLLAIARDHPGRLFGWRGVISIIAGVTAQQISDALDHEIRVVRVMPNLAVEVARGMSAIAPGPRAEEPDIAFAERLFAAMGQTMRLDERLFDVFTALAGSGPAYLFYLAEAMQAGAVRLGMDPAQAAVAVKQTLTGAAALWAQQNKSPAELRASVTSPAGTTAAATASLDRDAVPELFARALQAGRDRGAELSATLAAQFRNR